MDEKKSEKQVIYSKMSSLMSENEVIPSSVSMETSPQIGKEQFLSTDSVDRWWRKVIISPTLTYEVIGMEQKAVSSKKVFNREISIKRNNEKVVVLELPLSVDSIVRLKAGIKYVAEQLVELGYENTIQFWYDTTYEDFIDSPALNSPEENI